MPRRVRLVARAVSLFGLLLVALATPTVEARCRPDAAELARYRDPGPFPVSQFTLAIVDPSRPTPANGSVPAAPGRALPTEVWSPASSGSAPYPLIVFGHGLGGSRSSLSSLSEHLASHGFIVAAPDFPLSNGGAPGGPTIADIESQPGDVRAVIDHLLEAPELAGAIDPDRIGASGYSWGGLTTLLVTYHRALRDRRIRAALAIAAPACFVTPAFFGGARVPLLLLDGGTDLIVPLAENGTRAFRASRGRSQLVVIENGSHTGFSAFASLFAPVPHYDVLACQALTTLLGTAWDDPSDEPFRALVAPRAGVVAPPGRCPVPCAPEAVASVPPSSMPGARQQELLRIVATAFFDARLRDNDMARCVLARGLRAIDDVTVRGR